MDVIFQALDLILDSRLWKGKPPSHTLKILLYMKSKNWLYTPMIDGKVKAVIGAYRIPEVTDEILDRLPTEEQGKILYIAFVVSINKEDNIFEVVRNATREYLEANPDVEEIVLEDKNDKLRRYKIGENNGKK